MKDFSKYYTSEMVSNALMQFVNLNDNAEVVDICCGKCNLLHAAYLKNNKIKCLGNDIIDVGVKWCKTTKSDARLFALKSRKRFDVALANPPFGKLENNFFSYNFFKGQYSKVKSNRIEIEMLLANLRILKQNGYLMIIMPTTFVNGSTYLNIRKIIAKNNNVAKVIDLPSSSFYPEKIRCCAILIKKAININNSSCCFYKMLDNYEVKFIKEISYTNMIDGEWGNRFFEKSEFNNLIIQRGNISSNLFSKNGIPVLHTSGRKSKGTPSIRYMSESNETKRKFYAERGDILISRVGSSAGMVCFYDGDKMLVSDCLMLIKSPDENIKQFFKKSSLTSLVKGVATPHITANDIYNMYNEWSKCFT